MTCSSTYFGCRCSLEDDGHTVHVCERGENPALEYYCGGSWERRDDLPYGKVLVHAWPAPPAAAAHGIELPELPALEDEDPFHGKRGSVRFFRPTPE